ncbi:MAG: hypothetical protein KBB01_00510 [Candidatus Omnitrophica bacterium]|jgi:hypothetical protein|nr:hypothetical protein [Candidatus Omnitrophota bacterium]
MLKKKSQNILEYVIILAAIVAAIIFAAREVIRPAVDNMFADSADVIDAHSMQFLDKAGGGLYTGE